MYVLECNYWMYNTMSGGPGQLSKVSTLTAANDAKINCKRQAIASISLGST
jgi:hypothetical protein